MDGLFGSSFFSGSCTQKQEGAAAPKLCPFKSVDHAIQETKVRPEWIKLQQADRYSKERKELIKKLSLQLHPDMLTSLGCPAEYGNALMKLVSSMRTERKSRSKD